MWLNACSSETLIALFNELEIPEISFKENSIYQEALEVYKNTYNDSFAIVNMPIHVYKEMARRYCIENN